MRARTLLLCAAALAIGVAGERALYGWSDPHLAVPDAAAGWIMAGCGIASMWLRPQSRSGALMTATGFLWFAGNFASADAAWAGWLSAHALYAYRGPLVHLVLSYPSGRLAGGLERATVGAGYAAALITPVWRHEAATLALSAGLVLVATAAVARSRGAERRERTAALAATTAVAVAYAATSAVRLAVTTTGAQQATLLATQVGLSALAVVLTAGLVAEPWRRREVTDLVVELGDARTPTLRDELARSLGDPTLELGYWSRESNAFVDEAGTALALPPGAGRAVTVVEREGTPVAAVVHDPAVLDDARLLEAVATASRLRAANARLRAEASDRAAELQASRRRLLRAGDTARRELEQRLRDGAERRLLRIGEQLELAGAEAAREQLASTLDEVRELAAGLHPRALAERGLAGALANLAERSAVPVELEVSARPLPEEVAASVYFVCSEALANAAKYANAGHVSIRVSADGATARLEIADDGAGGADPSRGTGLRGLADRVETLGGTLAVESPPGRGTRISAELPLSG